MSGIRTFLTQNLMTKILALVLAILVWSFVELEVTDTQPRPRVRIELEFETRDVSVVQITSQDGKPIETVDVTLSGPRGALDDAPRELTCRHLIPAQITADITPSRPLPITLSPSDLRLPSRVHAEIVPETIYVTLDRLVDGYVPIKANKEDLLRGGDMRADLDYEVQSVLPPRIKIRAPAALIEKYQKEGIPILPVDVSGLTQTTPFAVSFPEAVRQRVQIGANQQAIVTIRIEPKPETHKLTVPVVKLLPPGGKHDFELRKPKEVEITVRGPKNAIDRFRQQPAPPVQVYVDLADYKVTPAQEGGIISDAPMGWVLKDPEQYPGLTVLGVPERAEEVFVRKKE